mgnify:CR=1 FL=1
MSNYPPGVTGNEPPITGEWPCDNCDGNGFDVDEDGKFACPVCNGTGILPEDVVDKGDTERLIAKTLQDVFGKDHPMEFDYDNEDGMVIYLDYKLIRGTGWLRSVR